MFFELEYKDPHSKARAGTITTQHGKIPTPIFMPVGTIGSVKGIHQRELLDDIQASIILANTYHLYLHPGMDILAEVGGVHQFINWKNPILTDSGGYQVYSLAKKRDITEEGVLFQSHIDGRRFLFTPENVIDIQTAIGANIIMAFDECTPYPATHTYVEQSMHLTHRWLKRCISHFQKTRTNQNAYQNLFGIVQGGVYPDLRQQSAKFVASYDLPGNAIGGVCHPGNCLYEITELVCDLLPTNKPRYLMGVGTPVNLLSCIELGVDMFDCVLPTRNGRNGMLFTQKGTINIKNNKFKRDFSTIDADLGGYVSTYYTKAYLHHLFRTHELLGGQIASIHNLTFYLWLVKEARRQILADTFKEWKKELLPKLSLRI